MLGRASPFVLVAALLLPGCLGATEDPVAAAGTTGDLVPAAVGPRTEEFPGEILVSVGTPVRTVNYGGTFVPTTIQKDANTTGFVLELEWPAQTPASQQLSVWIRLTGSGTLPPEDPSEFVAGAPAVKVVSGSSPLRVEIPAADLPDEEEYDVIVRASAEPAGAAVSQPVTLHVTTFRDLPFQASYSALG